MANRRGLDARPAGIRQGDRDRSLADSEPGVGATCARESGQVAATGLFEVSEWAGEWRRGQTATKGGIPGSTGVARFPTLLRIRLAAASRHASCSRLTLRYTGMPPFMASGQFSLPVGLSRPQKDLDVGNIRS
ncbi:MAG: hypothetical protein OXF56_20485, partial [Rhodobacteraceae bacterium]|nr:hypothetical protein [Paracoccaceae bacterium]